MRVRGSSGRIDSPVSNQDFRRLHSGLPLLLPCPFSLSAMNYPADQA